MKYINLGCTGLKISRICLGTMTYGTPDWQDWVLPEEKARPIIKRALELGVNFFDTADWYSLGVSEEVLGRALRDFARREEVIIATKVFYPMGGDPNQRGLSRKHIMDSIHASLERLGTDHVDLYQIHRWDEETPIEETLQALNDLVRTGKVHYLGASSMFAWQFAKALYLADLHGWSRFVSMQNHYNLIYREEEREMIPLCEAEGIGVIPWSPLARGFLAGTRHRDGSGVTKRSQSDDYAKQIYFRETDFEILERVIELSRKLNVTSAQIALAWLLHQHAVTAPIIGARTIDHLEQAVAAIDIQFSEQELTYLEELYQPHPVLGID